MPIYGLSVKNVGPFDNVEFEFDESINVFVGPNNSGKSTALWVLAEAAVYPFATPRKLMRKGENTFSITYGKRTGKKLQFSGPLPIAKEKGSEWETRWPEMAGVLKKIGYTCFIPALRRSTDFRSDGPTAKGKERDARGILATTMSGELVRVRDIGGLPFDRASVPQVRRSEEPEFARRGFPDDVTDAMQIDDSAIIQAIIELDYRAYREKRPAIRSIIDKIATMASEITEGFEMRFVGVGEDNTGLYPRFETPDGVVPLNTLSQGTQSVIQWLAHLVLGLTRYYEYPEDIGAKDAILIIDEIDAHLHPSWQRRILPALQRALPKLQVFCSTHSPLMLAGVKTGQVQLLRRDSKGKITVSRNEADIVGWSSDEILRNFLDVAEPTDVLTVEKIARLQQLRRKKKLSSAEKRELEILRTEVTRSLLAGPMTEEALTAAKRITAKTGKKRKTAKR